MHDSRRGGGDSGVYDGSSGQSFKVVYGPFFHGGNTKTCTEPYEKQLPDIGRLASCVDENRLPRCGCNCGCTLPNIANGSSISKRFSVRARLV